MITHFQLKSIEAKAFVPQEELHGITGCNINCDLNMQKATLSSDAKVLHEAKDEIPQTVVRRW